MTRPIAPHRSFAPSNSNCNSSSDPSSLPPFLPPYHSYPMQSNAPTPSTRPALHASHPAFIRFPSVKGKLGLSEGMHTALQCAISYFAGRHKMEPWGSE